MRYILQFSRNLLYLGTFEELGCTFKSENGYLEVIKESRSVLRAKRHNKLYFLQRKSCVGETNVAKAGDNTELWHRRLGHVSQKGQDIMVKKGYLDGKRVSILDCYESCIFGKFHRASYETGQHTSSQCLEYVHCDLWGSLNVHASLGKCHYFLSLVDDCSRKVWVYFLKIKDQANEKFVEWKHLVENQSGLKVKKLRIYNGLEFCNQEFDKFCSDHGIARHITIPYIPQQNGVVERMNITILERVRSVLSESGLPKVLWAESVNTVVYLINRTSSSAIQGKIPEQVWSKTVPKYDHLRKFGSICYFHTDEGKLQPRAKKEIFIVYPSSVKGYKIWSLDDKKSVFSRNVTFKETECYKDLLNKGGGMRERNTTFLDVELENINSGGEVTLQKKLKQYLKKKKFRMMIRSLRIICWLETEEEEI